MRSRLTSGFIPMPQLPAAQLPILKVFVTNLENHPHQVSVSVNKLSAGEKVNIVYEELEVAGDDQATIQLEAGVIAGEAIEILAEVPRSAFLSEAFAVVPSASVVTQFTGDGSTSSLQFVSAGDFVSV